MAQSLYFTNPLLKVVQPVRNCTGNPTRSLKSDKSSGYHHNFSSEIDTNGNGGGIGSKIEGAQMGAKFSVPGLATNTSSTVTGLPGATTTHAVTIATQSDNVLKQPLRQDDLDFMHWVVPITTAAGNPSECLIRCSDFPNYSNEAPSWWVDPNPDA